MDWIEALKTLAAVVGSLGAVGGAVVLAYKKGSRVVEFFKTAGSFEPFMQKTDVSLSRILSELTPNGGTSLKDAVHRIEHNQHLADQRMRAYAARGETYILEFNAKAECVWVSRPLCDFTGVGHDQYLQHGWINVVPEDEQPRVRAAVREAVEEKREFNFRTKVLKDDQKPVSVHWHGYVVRSTSCPEDVAFVTHITAEVVH